MRQQNDCSAAYVNGWQRSGGEVATYSQDVHELRERIVDERGKLDQRIIDKVVGDQQKRLRACLVAGGGQQVWT